METGSIPSCYPFLSSWDRSTLAIWTSTQEKRSTMSTHLLSSIHLKTHSSFWFHQGRDALVCIVGFTPRVSLFSSEILLTLGIIRTTGTKRRMCSIFRVRLGRDFRMVLERLSAMTRLNNSTLGLYWNFMKNSRSWKIRKCISVGSAMPELLLQNWRWTSSSTTQILKLPIGSD